MRPKALPMSQAAAHPAVRQGKLSAAGMVASAVPGPTVRCSLQCAPSAELIRKFPSSPGKAELSIAAAAMTGSNPAIAGN